MFRTAQDRWGASCRCAALVLFIGGAGLLRAQSNAIDAAVEGYVRDASSAALAGARVTARNTATNVTSETTASNEGYFRFPLLQVGTYDLTVEAAGFKTFSKPNLVLTAGQKIRLGVEMQLGSRAESVEVTADSSVALADTGSSAVGGLVTAKEVEDLPIVSRNIYNFQLLAPGVQGIPSTDFTTTQLTFGGNQRSAWSLDGVDNTERGSSRQIRMVIATPEAVEEVQILSNGYSAEFGRAAGGQVNVILKSGTNRYHGSELFQFRPRHFQARPSLSSSKPPQSWWDEAVTLGGPVKKDRIFFFTQFEHNPYNRPQAITITASNATALGLPASQVGNAPYGETYDTYVGKLNYRLTDRNNGYIRYARFTNHKPNSVSGLTIPNRGTNDDDRMNGGAVQLASMLSPTLLNELRYGAIERATVNAPVGTPDPYGVAVNITGVANIGYNPKAYTSTTELSHEAIDNLTWTRGRNTWKTGFEFQHTGFDIDKAENLTYTFGGLSAVSGVRGSVSALKQYLYTVAGTTDPSTHKPYTYTTFAEDGGHPTLQIGFNFINAFAQDEIRLTPRLTLNAGVRYESILFPELDANAPYRWSRKIDDDHLDFAPRVSLSWLATKDGKTVIRSAFGMFHDVPSLATFYNAALVNGHRFLSYQVKGADANAPVFPAAPTLTDTSDIVAPSINAFAPGFKNTYQLQGNVQAQREISKGFSVTLGYNLANLRHGLYSQNINLGTPVSSLADGRPVYGPTALHPNQAFNQINLIQAGSDTNYNGAFVHIRKRMSGGLLMQVAYTYSHAIADGLGEGGALSNPSSLRRDWGNADSDVRHNVAASGLYEPSFQRARLKWIHGFELSSMFFYNSGYPINTLSGVDLNNDGANTDRPLFRGRNDLTGPGLVQLGGRVQRAFHVYERYRVVLRFEAENALNHTNADCSTASGCTSAVVHTATASDFGRITEARDARSVQAGLKILF